MTDASNTPLSIDQQLLLVGRLIGRERHVATHGGSDALGARIVGALGEGDLEVLQRALDAIAAELGWDASQPMPDRPRHHHGFGPRHMPAPGEPHRFGEFGHGDHLHHGDDVDHDGCGRRGHGRGPGHRRHTMMADAFERGFTRGYEHAQRD
ncbi:hypothetical protein [Microbacterium dauci]|uniref:Uncharacterized protein n=1 Tax=Microbacterium dauci TaxID=3048008 RepID=A0ABT6ZDG9_9MICO|nr:hypothetical protein [Microbacterium sp. LX3-4]MDJ1114200.1 hypothetical protein [Microbacterium sp. LX3-4]